MINYITYTADIKNIYTYLYFPIKSSFLFSSNFYNENIVSSHMKILLNNIIYLNLIN